MYMIKHNVHMQFIDSIIYKLWEYIKMKGRKDVGKVARKSHLHWFSCQLKVQKKGEKKNHLFFHFSSGIMDVHVDFDRKATFKKGTPPNWNSNPI